MKGRKIGEMEENRRRKRWRRKRRRRLEGEVLEREVRGSGRREYWWLKVEEMKEMEKQDE